MSVLALHWCWRTATRWGLVLALCAPLGALAADAMGWALEAAFWAGGAAQDALDAARQARRATAGADDVNDYAKGQPASNPPNANSETGDRAARSRADQASQDAQDSQKAAADAAVASDNALDRARRAKAAAQSGDEATARKMAEEAQEWSQKAADAFSKAKDKADATAGTAGQEDKTSARHRAQEDTHNRRKNGMPPQAATDTEKTQIEAQKKSVDEGLRQRVQNDHSLFIDVWEARDILDEEIKVEQDRANKAGQRDPNELPLDIKLLEAFFGIKLSNGDLQTFPNADSPLSVPMVVIGSGDQFEIQLRVHNPNPFPVIVTGIDASMFGDRVSYLGPDFDQTINALESLWLDLGMVSFSESYPYTLAAFSLVTADDHRGLGPDIMVDFRAPEPPGIALVALGLLAASLAGRRRRPPGRTLGSEYLFSC